MKISDKQIKKRWLALFRTSHNQFEIEQGFCELIEKYSAASRYYHTLDHIKSCLYYFDQIKTDLSDPFCLEVAIWFHDVIYNPKALDNECLSAKYAAAFLKKINIKNQQISTIERLIRLTQHPSTPITMDEKYLIDIDLSILGAPDDIFQSYNNAIRQEYYFVADLQYQTERTKVLSHFLLNDKIYQTPYFFKKLEHKARYNIERIDDNYR